MGEGLPKRSGLKDGDRDKKQTTEECGSSPWNLIEHPEGIHPDPAIDGEVDPENRTPLFNVEERQTGQQCRKKKKHPPRGEIEHPKSIHQKPAHGVGGVEGVFGKKEWAFVLAHETSIERNGSEHKRLIRRTLFEMGFAVGGSDPASQASVDSLDAMGLGATGPEGGRLTAVAGSISFHSMRGVATLFVLFHPELRKSAGFVTLDPEFGLSAFVILRAVVCRFHFERKEIPTKSTVTGAIHRLTDRTATGFRASQFV